MKKISLLFVLAAFMLFSSFAFAACPCTETTEQTTEQAQLAQANALSNATARNTRSLSAAQVNALRINSTRLANIQNTIQERRTALSSALNSFVEKREAVTTATAAQKTRLRKEAITPFIQYAKSKVSVLQQLKEQVNASGAVIPEEVSSALTELEESAPFENTTNLEEVEEYSENFRSKWRLAWFKLKVVWAKRALERLDGFIDHTEDIFLKIQDSEVYSNRPAVKSRVDNILENRIPKYRGISETLKLELEDPKVGTPAKVARLVKQVHTEARKLLQWLKALRQLNLNQIDITAVNAIPFEPIANTVLTTETTTEDITAATSEGFTEELLTAESAENNGGEEI